MPETGCRFITLSGTGMRDGREFFHCSIKVVSRSAGRSVVAAAAYRLGERLHDERYDQVHDYTRRGGVLESFTIAPGNAPAWAFNPETLWNAAEVAETRKNSRLAREAELALPAFLSPQERRAITEEFAAELVERYGVAVTVALHAPGRGDERNYHAHILFTTREMLADGFGRKTRAIDDRKTGPEEIEKIRELAATVINRSLAAVNSDVRVDHRSFKDRGIAQEPTTHLGPAAAGMERRGEPSERGDINREAEQKNRETEVHHAELAELEEAIESERERISSPPLQLADAQERTRAAAEPFAETIAARGSVADIETDGLSWWQRAAVRIAQARDLAIGLAVRALDFWRQKTPWPGRELNRNDGGLER
jgi:hypothetical protein